MAEMNLKIASNISTPTTTVASLAVETSSVSKGTTAKEPASKQDVTQERVQEDNIERDIVAVSKDGDTVAVSKDGVTDVKESETASVVDEEEEEVSAYSEQPMEEIEAPELRPIEAPKVDETIENFNGISDERMEQMFAEGLISQYDYDVEMEARDAERDAQLEDAERLQQEAAKNRMELNRVEEGQSMIESAFASEVSDTYSPQIRSDVINSMQQRNAESVRRDADAKIQDYQLIS